MWDILVPGQKCRKHHPASMDLPPWFHFVVTKIGTKLARPCSIFRFQISHFLRGFGNGDDVDLLRQVCPAPGDDVLLLAVGLWCCDSIMQQTWYSMGMSWFCTEFDCLIYGQFFGCPWVADSPILHVWLHGQFLADSGVSRRNQCFWVCFYLDDISYLDSSESLRKRKILISFAADWSDWSPRSCKV